MLKTFKYRIYPTKAQRSKMEQTLELCRWTYNETLAYRKNTFEQEGKYISKYETHNLLPEWKKNKPELKEVFSQTLQNVQERVDLAFKAFFRRVKAGETPRYPRFKGKGWYDSFTYPQLGFKLLSGKLRLSKIGDIKIKLHRPIEGKIKRLTVRRSSTEKWFACFSVEINDPPKPPWKDGLTAGIDVGLENFATLSNGEKIDNPRFFRSEEKALAKAQRRLSKYETGTP
jgi:Transposase and inactivated derivatives